MLVEINASIPVTTCTEIRVSIDIEDDIPGLVQILGERMPKFMDILTAPVEIQEDHVVILTEGVTEHPDPAQAQEELVAVEEKPKRGRKPKQPAAAEEIEEPQEERVDIPGDPLAKPIAPEEVPAEQAAEAEQPEPEQTETEKAKADRIAISAGLDAPDLFVGDRFTVKKSLQKPDVEYDVRTIAQVRTDKITDTEGESVTIEGFAQFYELVSDAPAKSQAIISESAEGGIVRGERLVQSASGRVSVVGPDTDYAAGRVELLSESGERQEFTTPFMIKQFYQMLPAEAGEASEMTAQEAAAVGAGLDF